MLKFVDSYDKYEVQKTHHNDLFPYLFQLDVFV